MAARPYPMLVAALLALAAAAEPATAQLAVSSTVLVFPHFEIAKKSRTELRISNPGGVEANVQVAFLCAAPSPGGVCASSTAAPFSLAPGATRVIDVDVEGPPCTEGAARTVSDQPLAGSYTFGKGGQQEIGAAIDGALATPVLVSDFRATRRKEGSRLDLVDAAAVLGGPNPERTVTLDVFDGSASKTFATGFGFTCVASVRLGDLDERFEEQSLGSPVGFLRIASPGDLLGALSELRGSRGVTRPLFSQP